MAETNHTQAQEQMMRGAQCSLMALGVIEAIANNANSEAKTWQQHFASEQSAIDELINASGTNDDWMRGFLSGLGEYLFMTHWSGTFGILNWKPAATMTPEELTKHREEMQEDA